MASIRKQKAGAWRVQVRRKGRSVSENFVRHEDAKQRAVDAERQINRGETPAVSRGSKLKTLSDLIDLHISDMKEVGKAPGRTKETSLAMLKLELGHDAMGLIEEQRAMRANDDDRIFPYNRKSVSKAFTRSCQELEIEDLHFHDMRHEGARTGRCCVATRTSNPRRFMRSRPTVSLEIIALRTTV